jgi:glycerol dehydrogenase
LQSNAIYLQQETDLSITPFVPQAVYAPDDQNHSVPRVLVAPPKYIQGPRVLDSMGRYMSLLRIKRVGVLASTRGHSAEAGRVIESLAAADIECVAATFSGECSLQAIAASADELDQEAVDCLVAVGGGKCVDAGKSVAYRLDVPLVVVPTLASNDAPCSSVSVLYTPTGVASGAEFFPHSPVLVVVDTDVVARASERYLVAGMGDAMATWYEAKVCLENPAARNVLGARPTLASYALGEVCAKTLYADGLEASAAVQGDRVDDALERVVEANTLLSGIGFESGGLAAAHGLAQGYTTLPEVEANYLHGEMVAMGVVTQLLMENNATEASRVAQFFAQVGLPIHLGQFGLGVESAQDKNQIASVVAGAMAFQPIHNLPFEVTHARVNQAILDADTLGKQVTTTTGDVAYRRLQS